MRLLVTGGAGFIGSNFIRWIFEHQAGMTNEESKPARLIESVCVLDALTYAGNLANLRGLECQPNFHFVKGDIRDGDCVKKLLLQEKIDAIANFAAQSHVDRSIVEPLLFVRTNIEGTQVLLTCARDAGVKRFLQVSTDEVYGSLGLKGRFTEKSPLAPSSAYAASKAGADLLVLASSHTYGFPAFVSRCTNNYGPYQFPEKLIPLFITNALMNEHLPLYGDGKNVRSWLHVDDHSRALVSLLHQGRVGHVYNIGPSPDSEKENREVTGAILNILRKPEGLIKSVADRLGHDRRYAVDYSKIKLELGWESRIDFHVGLEKTVRWYEENREWWMGVKSGEYRNFYDLYYCERLRAAP